MAYTPNPLPVGEELGPYLLTELQKLSAELALVEEGRFLPIRSSAPVKPREGMLAVADGSGWDPGSGKGLYEYRNGSWVKL
jgi:hypothetical protein